MRFVRAGWPLLLATLLLSFAALIVGATSLNADSAWLLVAAGRLLDGVQPYAAIGETNPPLVVWLHTVPVALARLLDIAPDLAFIITVWALSVASVAAIWRRWPSRWMVLAAFALGPMAVQVYGQREHMMVLLALPFMLQLLPQQTPRWLPAIPAAIGLCLKPYFLLWPLMVLLLRLGVQRHWRAVLNLPVLLLGALIGLYALYLLASDRNYIESVLPDLLRYYDAFAAPTAKLLRRIVMLGVLFTLPLVFYAVFVPSRRLWMLAVMSSAVAALLMVWLQQKGWTNHWYLFLSLMLAANAAVVVWAAQGRERFALKLVMILAATNVAALAGLNAHTMMRMVQHDWPLHSAAQTALLQQQKGETLYALSFDMHAAFPSGLQVGKRFVGQYPHQWFLAKMVRDHRETTAPKSTDESHYFRLMVDDFAAAKPELVVVTKRDDYYHPTRGTFAFDFIAYYAQDPNFKRAWKRYRPIGQVGPYHYYQREADTN